jgi:hypothetical protein
MNLERGSILSTGPSTSAGASVAVVVAPVPGICAHVTRHVWRRSRLPPNRKTRQPAKLSNVSMPSARG